MIRKEKIVIKGKPELVENIIKILEKEAKKHEKTSDLDIYFSEIKKPKK